MTGAFSNCASGKSNATYGSFGLGGFYIACVGNFDMARVDLVLMNNDPGRNKAAFDALYEHKDEIERKVGASLCWERSDDSKSSWINYHLYDVSMFSRSWTAARQR